jgi:trk system potassium uptake protein TrkH
MNIARTICLGFFAVISIGTILLTMPFAGSSGNWNDPLVALFTSTSAVCVTGLSVVDPGTYFSFWGQLIVLLLVQVGGLGYMTTTTFLLLLLGRKFDLGQKFAIQESFERPFVKGSAFVLRSIIATTLIFEITGIFLMLPVFVRDHGLNRGLWLSIFHSVSAWNNAGFSLFRDQLVGYHSSWTINLTITGLIILGGIGYPVIMEVYLWLINNIQRKRERFCFSLNFKVVTSTTLILLFLGTISIWLAEVNNSDTISNFTASDQFLAAWFQSVTCRTAGFNTIDNGKLTTAGLFLTMGLMFVGASPSGTGGGIKTTTLRILFNCTRSVLEGKDEVVLYQRKVPIPLLLKSVGVVFGSAATVVLGTIFLSWIDADFDLIQILFEVISAFATVGLSMGITASLSASSKLILVFVMYTGRVGILLLIAAILGEIRPTALHYPEENLLVG